MTPKDQITVADLTGAAVQDIQIAKPPIGIHDQHFLVQPAEGISEVGNDVGFAYPAFLVG